MATASEVDPGAAQPADRPSDDGGTGRATRSWQAALVIALAVAAVLAVVIWWVAAQGATDEVRVRIPVGTGRQLEAGDDPAVVDTVINLDVGDTLVVENDDDRLHVLGSLSIGPGATARLVYDQRGRFTGPSSATLDGTVTIIVR